MSSENNNLHPREIVSAYADLLASINDNKQSEPLRIIPLAMPESLLPFPSNTIKHALAIYLLHQNYKNKREIIEDAYIYLNNFIPDEEYNLFYMLQKSRSNIKNQLNNGIIEVLDIMNMLRIRSQNINIKKEEALEELNSLRRIMNLPVILSTLDNEEEAGNQEKVQELRLNI